MPKVISTNLKGGAAPVPPYPQLLLDLKDKLSKKDSELAACRAERIKLRKQADEETERRRSLKTEFDGVEEFLRKKHHHEAAKHAADLELLMTERGKVHSLRKKLAYQETKMNDDKTALQKAKEEIDALKASAAAWNQLAQPEARVIEKTGVTCPICLDLVTVGGVGLMDIGCGHLLCVTCVETWKKTRRGKRVCPVCKVPAPYDPTKVYIQ